MPKREPTPPKGAASNESSAVSESSSAEAVPAESAMVRHTRKAAVPHAAVPHAAVPHAATATEPGVRTERRAGGNTRYRGQRNHDLAHHAAFSIDLSCTHQPATKVIPLSLNPEHYLA
jgi:hypothetical protein